ncbi:D-alanyl-D-alanine carboxypeptidase [Chloroflexi bacterium TSY]|nr:D-alanyl-D-alanine carboxypeptidase [Chloroflexi bacterium TSY]
MIDTRYGATGLLLFVLLSSLLLLTGFGTPRLVDRNVTPGIRLSLGQLRAIAKARQAPQITAKAALLYDVDGDIVLFEQNQNQALPPASLTKLMTALLILEQTDLTAQVTIRASDLIGGATMGLQAGETVTVDELLQGLLIPSGNDASMTLARHAAGNVDRFIQQMNQRAEELNLQQTHFVNPHGFDAPNQMTSANDMLRLTLELLKSKKFREIVATSEAIVAGHSLRNTNQLLRTFVGADGIKTGTTPAAGQSLIASITRKNHQVLLIILGSRNRYADARTLYTAYEANYVWADGKQDTLSVLNRVYGANGTIWYLQPEGESPEMLQQRWISPPLTAFRRLEILPSSQTWYAGMRVGVLEWRLGHTIIGNQLLILK